MVSFGTRNLDHSYGFDLDPGTPGGWTSLHLTVWDTAPALIGTPTAFEGFVLKRPRHGERLAQLSPLIRASKLEVQPGRTAG